MSPDRNQRASELEEFMQDSSKVVSQERRGKPSKPLRRTVAKHHFTDVPSRDEKPPDYGPQEAQAAHMATLFR